jgi:hypothetical protein
VNPLLLGGVVANAICAGGVWLVHGALVQWMLPFLALSLLGLTLIALGHQRAGAFAVIGGSLAFVPLGIVAIFGARRTLDAHTTREFELRRAAIRDPQG